MKDYDDRKVLEYLRFGWPLNAYDTQENSKIPPNQKGAREHPDEIRSYLKKELKAGSIIGPFIKNPLARWHGFHLWIPDLRRTQRN